MVLNARDGDLASRFGLALPRGAVSESRHSTLTKREQEVYSLLAEGKTNREIASALFISELTAKVHVGRVLRKLGVRSRTQAALKAARDTHYER